MVPDEFWKACYLGLPCAMGLAMMLTTGTAYVATLFDTSHSKKTGEVMRTYLWVIPLTIFSMWIW